MSLESCVERLMMFGRNFSLEKHRYCPKTYWLKPVNPLCGDKPSCKCVVYRRFGRNGQVARAMGLARFRNIAVSR